MCIAEAQHQLAIARGDLEDLKAAYKAERALRSREHRRKRFELKRSIRRLAELVSDLSGAPEPLQRMAAERKKLNEANRKLSRLIDGEAVACKNELDEDEGEDEQVEAMPRSSKLRRLSKVRIDGEGMGEPAGLLEAEQVRIDGEGFEAMAEPAGLRGDEDME